MRRQSLSAALRVALFPSCMAEGFYPRAVEDARWLLRAAGAEVTTPTAATCCGQPAYSTGHHADARAMMRQCLDAFDGADYVVLPSGSCASMLRCFAPGLMAGSDAAPAADALATRSYELAQFLDDVVGWHPPSDSLAGRRLVVHHGCHALRELRAAGAAENLLRAAGAELLSWPAQHECCGFGGAFAVKMPEVSAAMADRKLDTLPAAELLVSADPGCLLQLAGRAAATGRSLPVRHLASVLREAADGA
ncbi:(Fe-S)-binding protein [Acidihalobacter yilgarnensis]|uniref:(Fe-S)-binding protein n=1 Tax=Acidihalobacter yilgarnensis TaxID=2819280 RepID=UPI0018D3C335|nr:(Fe-S)-binding protein [Acidihalobacter yilgarnensis]